MKDPSCPIGLFDSGFGGLTVLREVLRCLPLENTVYLGDTARLPYGNKSPQTILQYALKNSEFLLEKNIKLLIVACHTACSHALPILQERLEIPVIGVIEPGLDLLARQTQTKRVAVLATASTVDSGVYQKALQEKGLDVHGVPCPLFVPLVEEGFANHLSASLIAHSYLDPLRGKGIDAALLACTHYPLLKEALQKVLGPEVQLVEPAAPCARQARDTLERAGQLNQQTEPPRHAFYASDDPEKFRRLGKIFLGKELGEVSRAEF